MTVQDIGDVPMNELQHYGVKGMKWGVRRTRDQLRRTGSKIKSATKAIDKAIDQRDSDIEKARDSFPEVRKEFKEAKRKYKTDRKEIGRKAARESLRPVKDKYVETLNTALESTFDEKVISIILKNEGRRKTKDL